MHYESEETMKLMGLVVILLFTFMAMAGCSTAAGYVGLAQDAVLPKLEPEQRATYRDGLQDATESYDERYGRDGLEKYPEGADTETTEEATDEPTETPESADTTEEPVPDAE